MQEENFKDAKTTTWIGKHIPIFISISSNLAEKPIYLCKTDPHHLVASFIGALENLASQSRAKLENLFPDIETTVNIKLGSVLEKLTQRHNQREQLRRFDLNQYDCRYKTCASTQILRIQQNQLIELWEPLQRFGNVLFVFTFHSARQDFNLIKLYLLPIFLNERDFEPTVIQKGSISSG